MEVFSAFQWAIKHYSLAKPWKTGRILTNGNVEDILFQAGVIIGENEWGGESMRHLFSQRL